MDSNPQKFTLTGILLPVAFIGVSIVFASLTNPFDQAWGRVLYAAAIGGLGGCLGAVTAIKLGLTKHTE